MLAVSRSQNLYCSHRLNTTEVDSLYLEMCSGDIYKIQMCYFIDKKLIMMVEVMFKNWGLDSPGRQKQSPRDYHPTGRPGKQSSRQLAFSGSFLSEGPHGRGAKAAVGTQRRFC